MDCPAYHPSFLTGKWFWNPCTQHTEHARIWTGRRSKTVFIVFRSRWPEDGGVKLYYTFIDERRFAHRWDLILDDLNDLFGAKVEIRRFNDDTLIVRERPPVRSRQP